MGAEVLVSAPRVLEKICQMYVRFSVLQLIITPFSYLCHILISFSWYPYCVSFGVC
jgi:hypothetical protein